MITGQVRRYYHKWKFRVEIENVEFAGFMKIGPLKSEAATVLIWEGGKAIPAGKSPGRMTYPPLTCSRGATDDRDMYTWFEEVFDAATGTGTPDPEFKRDFDIVQQDRNDTERRRWSVFQAWPKSFTAGDWDNDADEYTIEEAELEYDYYLRRP